VLAESTKPRHYVALARALRVYERPFSDMKRYLLVKGTYPYRCKVRTPCGPVAPLLHHPHDMITVHEIFCREDYKTTAAARVVVDVGSNIGISALYFLTRHPDVRCYLYEPVPENVTKLEANLAAFRGRYELEQVAVADRAGTVSFGVEESGRYGGIGVKTGRTLEVGCRHVNDVLASVLAEHGRIDVLKIDTEGAEPATVRSIGPDLLRRIALIYYETPRRESPHMELFDVRFASQTMRLRNRSLGG
jgi:FkbM family methyltransferase